MRHVLAFCLLVFPVVLCAQRIPHPVLISDPLPSPYITDIAQDSAGFTWIGTSDGLCRYDGSGTVIFRQTEGDPRSLAGNFINELLYDDAGNILWVATENGLSALYLDNYRFHNPRIVDPVHPGQELRIGALSLTDDQQIWFSVSGTGPATYLPDQDTVLIFPVQGDFPAPMQPSYMADIMDIAVDPADPGIIWMGTGGGLIRFDTDDGLFVPYFFRQSDLETELYQNQIRTVLPLQDSTLCLAPWSEGIVLYRPDRTATAPQFVSPDAYRAYQGTAATPPLFLIDENRVCYNTVSSCVMDLRTFRMQACITMRNALGKWYDMRIIQVDQKGRKWGASEYGVHLFDPLSEQIHNYQFPAQDYRFYINSKIWEVADGRILIAYENAEGAFVFDPENETFQTLLPTTKRYLTDSIFNAAGFIRRPDGEIWLLERHKVYRVSLDNGALIPLHLPIDTLPHFWSSILQDRDGTVWLGSAISGLVQYMPETGDIKTFERELESGDMATSAWLTHLFQDSRQNIWIRKEWGYSIFLRDTRTFLNFNTFQGQKIRIGNFLEDAHGNMWSCYPGGLLKMSTTVPEKGVIEVRGHPEGLTSLDVYSIAQDTRGNLWMMTRDGLQEYQPVRRICSTYDDKDGMILFDERFNRNPARLCYITSLSGGRLAYAPRAGFSYFHPDSLRANTEIPVPYIRQIRVADSVIATDLFRPLPGYNFPFRLNDIEIECSAIAYSQSANLRYEYHLGNAHWKELNDRRILFSSLSPGEYQFYFRVVNSSGMPSDVVRYAFCVRPPWPRTWWFLGFCAAVAVTAVWFFVRTREKRLKRIQRKEQEVQVLMASLESRALRNQMNPHFLFNIFNNIQELILTGDTEKAYTYTTKFSKLLRMILDNARKDEITIAQECTFLTLYLELEALRFDDAFDYTVDIEEGLELMHIPVFVIQPLVENAIRHGLLPKTGNKELRIVFSMEENALVCTVMDNGVGLNGVEAHAPGKDRDHALQLIRQRLRHLNGASLTVADNRGGEGAMSRVYIPMKI